MLKLRVWMLSALLLLTACSFVVKDTRTQEEKDAYATKVAEQTVQAMVPTATADAPPVTVEPQVVPSEEVGETLPDPTPQPPAIVIKGNISKSGEKIYHMPGQANYDKVKIDESKGERFFTSEEEAKAAGFRKALR